MLALGDPCSCLTSASNQPVMLGMSLTSGVLLAFNLEKKGNLYLVPFPSF